MKILCMTVSVTLRGATGDRRKVGGDSACPPMTRAEPVFDSDSGKNVRSPNLQFGEELPVEELEGPDFESLESSGESVVTCPPSGSRAEIPIAAAFP